MIAITSISFRRSVRSLLGGGRALPFTAAACSLALAACHPSYTPDALRERGLKPGEGLIVGSYKVLAVGPDGKKTTRSKTDASAVLAGPASGVLAAPLQGRMQDGNTELFAVPVPAGEYQVTGTIGDREFNFTARGSAETFRS